MPAARKTREERFEAKVRRDPDGHWIWIGAQDSMGYGRFAWTATRGNVKIISAARAALRLAGIPITDDQEPDHLCKRRLCVNPECLEAVSERVNILRSDNPTALLARQTHCKYGHQFTPENTYHHSGRRVCRACNQRRVYEHVARRNGTAPPIWQGWLGGC